MPDLTREPGWPYETMHFKQNKPKNGSELLLEAHELINGDRNEDYGHPLDDFTKTATMWSAILDTEVSPEQVGLCMIAVKISRQLNIHRDDNLVDMAGYAGTVGMIVTERERREHL